MLLGLLHSGYRRQCLRLDWQRIQQEGEGQEHGDGGYVMFAGVQELIACLHVLYKYRNMQICKETDNRKAYYSCIYFLYVYIFNFKAVI